MRHAPTAPSRLRRAAVLAPLLLAAWCAVQPPAAAQPPTGPGRSASAPPRPSAHEVPAGVHPAEAEDHSSALVPIAVGLALTAIASYKHRGLPRGH
ncbi:hypothetical protein [Streptacidiphilus sp. P02-A3a]|uniref:hypothetical protein n=1 Tax=Streptacidiphilus sp. P02-A3a TaxID=2704468 RepID=UPI0015FB12D1|nr:hypothetical protein [Streptacidiphilus sp. P02-A3a]QMU67985.1 hypothetical protein GXP74_06890 [Streptacidiphilus sp. P02-A3a]